MSTRPPPERARDLKLFMEPDIDVSEKAYKIRLTSEQRLLIALGLSAWHSGKGQPATMRKLSESSGIAEPQLCRVMKRMSNEGIQIQCNSRNEPKTYSLTKEYLAPAVLLGWALAGWKIEDLPQVHGEPIDSARPEEFSGERFPEGLEAVMRLILDTLPKVKSCLDKTIGNIEEDPCFNRNPPVVEHWFFAHGISGKLQTILGFDKVLEWVEECNEKGIGEVVINDVTFAPEATSATTRRIKLVPLRSHEYWLTYEPVRPEGYIVFGNRVAVIFWGEKNDDPRACCRIYTDERLARILRNNVKILRLIAHPSRDRCCQSPDNPKAKHKTISPNPKSPFYRRMWT